MKQGILFAFCIAVSGSMAIFFADNNFDDPVYKGGFLFSLGIFCYCVFRFYKELVK